MHAVEQFFDALVEGSPREAVGCLAVGATIDDPRGGRIEGASAAERWAADAHAWLAGLSARCEPVRLTAEGDRAVVERLVRIQARGEDRQLPVAVAADADAGGRLRAVRIYHSFWTVERAHRVRARLLPTREDIAVRPPIDAYQRALVKGDIDGVLACYERDGALREPAGAPFVHRGLRGLRRFYGALLLDGGLALERGSVVDDGEACAIEYTITRWGRTPVPPQAGMVVYERGARGLIRETRVYDDVDPPRG